MSSTTVDPRIYVIGLSGNILVYRVSLIIGESNALGDSVVASRLVGQPRSLFSLYQGYL